MQLTQSAPPALTPLGTVTMMAFMIIAALFR
jgi:hypothetical protein